MERLKLFLQESRQEFKRVNWPTSEKTIRLTAIVVFMSLGMAAFLGAIDFILIYILNNFVLNF